MKLDETDKEFIRGYAFCAAINICLIAIFALIVAGLGALFGGW